MMAAIKQLLNQEQRKYIAQLKRDNGWKHEKPASSARATRQRRKEILDFCTDEPRTSAEIEDRFGYMPQGGAAMIRELKYDGYGNRYLAKLARGWKYQTITRHANSVMIEQHQTEPIQTIQTTETIEPEQLELATPVAETMTKPTLKNLQNAFTAYLWNADVSVEDKTAILRFVDWYKRDE